MKKVTQTIITYAIWALIFSACSYAYAVGTWNEPAAGTVPPQNNTDAPINTSTTSQTKTGFLWTQGIGSNAGGYFATTVGVGVSSSTNPTTLGLTGVFGGKVGATEYCDESGDDCLSVAQLKELIVPEDADGLSCPTNPNLSTMTALDGKRLTIPFATYAEDIANDSSTDDITYDGTTLIFSTSRPDLGTGFNGGWSTANYTLSNSCMNSDGCVLKQVVYRRRSLTGANAFRYGEKVERIRFVEYNEDSASGLWTSTDNPNGGINGNTTSTNIIKPYFVTSGGATYQVLLRDDKSTEETQKATVRPYDNWRGAGQEIYFCSYASDTAI